ncbi:MAG: hypothetical protein JSS27_02450 [Planctomycetes bacterium]|nr:hypothetical protein [Planctomycetota bacterium]
MEALGPGLPILDFGNLTATAILGWYAWHTVAKTIPGIIRAFREETSALRAECRDEREALYVELSAERQQRHHDTLAVVAALHELSARISGLDRAAQQT